MSHDVRTHQCSKYLYRCVRKSALSTGRDSTPLTDHLNLKNSPNRGEEAEHHGQSNDEWREGHCVRWRGCRWYGSEIAVSTSSLKACERDVR